MANEEEPLKSCGSPAVREHWTHANILLFIMSHAWASAYAKIQNSNKESAQPPTSQLDGLAELRVWHISTKMSGTKLLLNWSRYWQAEAKTFLHFKEDSSASKYVSFWQFHFQLCWFFRFQSDVIDYVPSLNKDTSVSDMYDLYSNLVCDPLKWSMLAGDPMSKVTFFYELIVIFNFSDYF